MNGRRLIFLDNCLTYPTPPGQFPRPPGSEKASSPMCAAHASDATSPEKATGSDAVKAALIQAAGELLGEVGPRGVSVRDIAQRAGVNHGQIHHYFGGKRGLLEAAIRHLARGHYAHSLELAGGGPIPPPLSLSEDRPYFRALCQSVMDGDLELVRAVERATMNSRCPGA